MLTRLQKKQFAAMISVMRSNPEQEIDIELSNAYFKETDKKEFIEKAINYAGCRVDGKIEGVIYLSAPVAFFEHYRTDIINWFERYTDYMGHDCVVSYVHDLTADYDDYITIDDIGQVVYGEDKSNAYYKAITKRLSMFVAENIAALFYDEAERMQDNGDFITEFSDYIDFTYSTDGYNIGKAVKVSFLGEIDTQEFTEKSTRLEKINGKVIKCGAAQHKQPLVFFDENRSDLMEWLQSYIKYDNGLSTLDYIEKLTVATSHWLSKDDISKVIYAKNNHSLNRQAVAGSIVGLLADVLASDYQKFLNIATTDIT